MDETQAAEKVRIEVVEELGAEVIAHLTAMCEADPSITVSEIASVTCSVYLTTMMRCIELAKQASPLMEADVRDRCLESITRVCARITNVVN